MSEQVPPDGAAKGKDRVLDMSDLTQLAVQEKKQKACTNCRKSKLKCLMDVGAKSCSRCRIRGERCVFRPRGYDEDWRQALTSDLHAALSHLQVLSAAVHQLFDHLASRDGIAAFISDDGSPLDKYVVPRDLKTLQEWEEDYQEDSAKTRVRRKRTKDQDNGSAPNKRRKSSSSNPSSERLEQGAMTNVLHDPHGLDIDGQANAEILDLDGMLPSFGASSDQLSQEVRTADSDHLQLSSPFEVDLTQIPSFANRLPLDAVSRYAAGSIASLTTSGDLRPSAADQHKTIAHRDHDPLSSSSAHIPTLGTPSWLSNRAPVAAYPQPNLEPGHKDEVVPPGTIIGSKDGRANVITLGIARPEEAATLITYFHRHLASFLHGYRLSFGHFPFLPDGPRSTTPLIFGVMSLLASERLVAFQSITPALSEYVTQLLLSNPSMSWLSLNDAKKTQKMVPDVRRDDQLDPELCIGCEEVTGAIVLSMYMTPRETALQIAELSFFWARGWIRLLCGPPRNTLAELMNFVPGERHASPADMARIWLLGYIVTGLNSIVVEDSLQNQPDGGLNPEHYCEALAPSTSMPDPYHTDSDTLLTSQARLIYLIRTWSHDRISCRLSSSGATEFARQMHTLTQRTNSSLQWWREEFVEPPSSPAQTRQVWLVWHFTKTIVNHKGAEALLAQPRLRAQCLKDGISGAISFFEICRKWEPKEELQNLPCVFFDMIGILVGIIQSTAGQQPSAFDTTHASSLLREVGLMLHLGDLPSTHPSQMALASCLKAAEEVALCVDGQREKSL